MKIHSYAKQGNISGVATELAKGADINGFDSIAIAQGSAHTPLMVAVSSPAAGIDMVRFLVEQGASLNTVEAEYHNTALSLAVSAGNLDKIRFLLEVGANIRYQRPDGYNALIDVMHGRDITKDENLVPIVQLLIHYGAPLNGRSSYGESALSVASNRGRFDAVQVLLEAGADAQPLGWIDLMHAIVFGTLDDVNRLLNQGADVSARDSWARTPWLLSLQAGDIKKATVLLSAGADRHDRGRCGKTPIMYAIENEHIDVLRWLIETGFDIEETDEFGLTPLMMAVECGSIEAICVLLNAGANPTKIDSFNSKAIDKANTLEIIQILIEAGEDLSDLNTEMRRVLTGIQHQDELQVSQQEYVAGKHRRFGTSNPHIMSIPFWQDMVRTGMSAWQARATFNDTESWSDKSVWCFSRFGTSITQLPDGRIVEIAGEHEDYYDPDFCIYNDVIVHQGNGDFEIFGYPEAIFPPTDFHSATLVEGFIYIIGNVGYTDQRIFGETPVYRLHCDTFQIEKICTTGEKPGWIGRHKAHYQEPHQIYITGGKLCVMVDGKEDYVDNTANYVLDLTNFCWSRVSTSHP
jgi:ankyrin repeat protein